jgi:L-asparaginase/Glu-tRNA(Gln) amidotransferase subunit D
MFRVYSAEEYAEDDRAIVAGQSLGGRVGQVSRRRTRNPSRRSRWSPWYLNRMQRVAIIGTGGTISSVGRDPLDVWEYMDHGKKLEADELVAGIPELTTVADVLPVRHRSMSSPAIGPKDWLELGALVEDVAARAPRVDGIVVTHGTTLKEPYFLNLTSKADVPIVVLARSGHSRG